MIGHFSRYFHLLRPFEAFFGIATQARVAGLCRWIVAAGFARLYSMRAGVSSVASGAGKLWRKRPAGFANRF
jgi:hypothetical protein